jgi:uncharacterized protein YjdB
MRSRSFPHNVAVGILLLGSVLGCEGPIDPTDANAGILLAVQATTSGSEMVEVIAIEVTGAGIPVPIIVNLQVVDGSASGTVAVPPGSDRTYTGRGFDAQANITHEGVVVTDVRPGQATVRIPMYPRGVGVPIEVTAGAYVLSVAPETAELEVGATLPFVATVTDGEGVAIDNPDLTWGSSNPAFATVDAEGMVTGVHPGAARIVVSFGGAAAEAWVTVGESAEPVVARVQVSPETAEIHGAGETTRLTAAAFDADDEPVTDLEFTWASNLPDVATVNGDGLVTAVAAGEAMITAHVGTVGGSATVAVTVEEPVATSIVVTPETSTASRGETEQFTATVYDQFGSAMPDVAVVWTSLHPCTATVDSDGLATALSGGGATIVASAGDLKGSATLDVAHASGVAPTSVQGDWLVCQTSTGEHKLTLHLEHEAGSEIVTGTVTMASGATSTIYSGRWSSDALDVSWTLLVQGGERTFSIWDGAAQAEDLLVGRYNDRYVLDTYEARIVRVLGSN